jgi:phosphate transport system substrate-binding protein
MLSRRIMPLYVIAALLIIGAAVYLFWPRPPLAIKSPDYVNPIPGITAENYPAVNGSTSTIPLSGLLLAKAMQLPAELRRGPYLSDPEHSLMVTFPRHLDVEKVRSYGLAHWRVRSDGTHGAYERLINDPERRPNPREGRVGMRSMQHNTGLILVAREPSEDELALAKQKGVELDVRPIALDAFVFVVNATNTVESLSLDDIRQIYTDKIVDWEQVGGKAGNIAAFTRNKNSGSQELMDKLVMRGAKMPAHQDRMMMTMIDILDRIADTPNAIGYSVFYYESIMAPNAKNRLMAIDDVQPTAESIADGSYPLVEPVYAVVRADAKPDSPEVRLRNWLLSPNGQTLIRQSGYIPMLAAKTQDE